MDGAGEVPPELVIMTKQRSSKMVSGEMWENFQTLEEISNVEHWTIQFSLQVFIVIH